MPTIQTGRIHSLRSALYKRSVPMLPDPISAAFTFAAAISTPLSPGAHAIRDRSSTQYVVNHFEFILNA